MSISKRDKNETSTENEKRIIMAKRKGARAKKNMKKIAVRTRTSWL